ncbi:MAG: glycosyl hydrolase family 28-related protein, partial [Puniceicoccales bacterium]
MISKFLLLPFVILGLARFECTGQPTAAQSGWRSSLYGEDWTPPADLNFSRDKFIQDYSYAGYARGEKPIPTMEDAPVLNVIDFGADPSGEKDSTSAIQRAIDTAAREDGPAVVYLPTGRYHVAPP